MSGGSNADDWMALPPVRGSRLYSFRLTESQFARLTRLAAESRVAMRGPGARRRIPSVSGLLRAMAEGKVRVIPRVPAADGAPPPGGGRGCPAD